jgi:hypothetical protein
MTPTWMGNAMTAWINLALDVVLIGLVTAGLVQAGRLIRHLAGLRQGRVEMESLCANSTAPFCAPKPVSKTFG